MRGSVRSSRIFSLAGAVAVVWLCGTGSAWAGHGPDLGTLQKSLDALCEFLGVTSCPQVPTVTQVVLEYGALETTSPDFARGPSGSNGFGGLGLCTVAGNPFSPTSGPQPPCDTLAINAVNRPAPSPIGLSGLANLTPLAFTINKQGQAVPTQPGDPSAVSFLYAVTTTTGATGQPDTLQLFYDYPPLMSSTFAAGQVVADISLPLQVLSTTDGSERLVCGAPGCPASGATPTSVATVQISAFCNGGPGCLTAAVIGDFSKAGTLDVPSPSAAALGVQFGLVFAASPNSSKMHAIFELQVPLLVTGPTSPAQCGKAISAGTPDPADCGNDPAYFGVTPSGSTNGVATGTPTHINQITGLPTAFSTDDLGFTPAFLLGAPVGIAPSAAPRCHDSAGNPKACPTVPPPTSTYPFCASFSVKGVLNRAVAAFSAIATDGTTYLSAPLALSSLVTCPF